MFVIIEEQWWENERCSTTDNLLSQPQLNDRHLSKNGFICM